jgi:hypothetical protein
MKFNIQVMFFDSLQILVSRGTCCLTFGVAGAQFAYDHKDDDMDGGETSEAPGSTLNCLEQAVDSLQKAVGLSCLAPGLRYPCSGGAPFVRCPC